MARKKRRRSRPASRSPIGGTPAATGPPPKSGDGPSPADGQGSARMSEAQKTRREQPILPGGRLSQRMRAESPYPKLTASLGRGLLAVGASPAILLVALLF